MKSLMVGLLILVLAGATVAGEQEWASLFDGESLQGWIQKNGTATYRVEAGSIVGRTMKGSPNSFLCTVKQYGDFELQFEVRVHAKLNSGVQIRSRQKTEKDVSGGGRNDQIGRVFGPQVEIQASGRDGAHAGYVYGEATGLGWLTEEEHLVPHQHFRDGEWNRFRVVAEGPRIRTWINDIEIADMNHDGSYTTHPRGFIGLQVHGIRSEEGPYEVAWRNIRLKEL